MRASNEALANVLFGLFGDEARDDIDNAIRLFVDSGFSASWEEAGLDLGRALRSEPRIGRELPPSVTAVAVRAVRMRADLSLVPLLGGKPPMYEDGMFALSEWTTLELRDVFGEYVSVNKDFNVNDERDLNGPARFILGQEENARRVTPSILKIVEPPLIALKRDGLLLRHIPEKGRGKAECMAAVGQNGMALKYVPNGVADGEICMAAVANNPRAIEFVPDGMRGAEICRMAVRMDGMTLRHVPPDVIDQDMCRDALRQAVSFGLGSLRLLLPVIPEQLFDEEMCEMAMDADPFAIKYLPPDLMTAEKYEEAIERAASEEGRRPRTS